MNADSLAASVKSIGLSVCGVVGIGVLLVRFALVGDFNPAVFAALGSLLGIDALRAGAPKP